MRTYAFDFAKFGREASYPIWPSKLWGIFLFEALFALLARHQTGAWLTVPISLGIIADLEGTRDLLRAEKTKSEVPSLLHTCRSRKLDAT